MSTAGIAAGAIVSGTTVANVLLRDGRKLGGIIPNVVVEEVHTDTLTITDHPVEQGAPITDHAFKNPAELSMRIGWSSSSLALDSVVSSVVDSVKAGKLTTPKIKTVRDIYEDLLKLQASRKPFDVSTGKRLYKDMLIKSISTTTDASSENALVVSVVLRQVIIVQTKAAKLKAEAQKNPAKTAPAVDRGTIQPQLSKLADSLPSFLKSP